MSDPTTALAEQKATVPEALELNALIVIGVIDSQNGARALLRSSQGQIARVGVGDEAFGVTIPAIGDDRVLATDWLGRTRALTLPFG